LAQRDWKQGPIQVAVLAIPFASSASICCAHDDLSSIDRKGFAFGLGEEKLDLAFRVEIIAETLGPVSCSGRVMIEAQRSLTQMKAPDVIFLPALQFHPSWMDNLGANPFGTEITEWLRNCYANGTTIVSLCSGSYILAEAGLLSGLPATTHWALEDHFAENYPAIDLQTKQAIVVTGQDGRIIMAGTGTYHSDLILYLVRRWLGRDAAHHFARTTGKYWAGTQQSVLARVVQRYNHEDKVISDAQKWLAKHLDQSDPVKEMAQRALLTERTFGRRFKKATGKTPLKYVQGLRVEEARCFLEKSRVPVSEIAARVGYSDVSSFSRVFQREIGISPGQYRKKFKLPPDQILMSEAL